MSISWHQSMHIPQLGCTQSIDTSGLRSTMRTSQADWQKGVDNKSHRFSFILEPLRRYRPFVCRTHIWPQLLVCKHDYGILSPMVYNGGVGACLRCLLAFICGSWFFPCPRWYKRKLIYWVDTGAGIARDIYIYIYIYTYQ